MKMSELIAIRPALEKMASERHNFSAAIKFAKFTRKIIIELQTFEVKRSELLNKYGVTQGENQITVPEENKKEFEAEMTAELERPVKVDPLDVTGLDMKVAPADLINCLELFD